MIASIVSFFSSVNFGVIGSISGIFSLGDKYLLINLSKGIDFIIIDTTNVITLKPMHIPHWVPVKPSLTI